MKRIICVLGLMLCMCMVSSKSSAKMISFNEWDSHKEVSITQKGVATYQGYLSKDGKNLWIYHVELLTDKKCTLKFPKEYQGGKLTYVGTTVDITGTDADCIFNILGDASEPWHDEGGQGQSGNKNVIQVALPSSVKVIYRGAFSCINNMKKITGLDNVERIEKYAFYSCKSLESVKLGAKVKKADVLEPETFRACFQLKEYEISSKHKSLASAKGLILSKSKKAVLMVPQGTTKVTVPEGVTTIEDSLFVGSKVKSLVLPASIKKIWALAFDGTALNTIIIPKKNNHYVVDTKNKILYSKKTGRLVYVYTKKKVLTLPKAVNTMTSDLSVSCDSRGLKKVIFSSSMKLGGRLVCAILELSHVLF